MNKLQRKIGALLGATVITGIAGSVFIFNPQKPVQAASFCQCVQYLKNRFGLPSPSGNANQWNDGYLQRNGFRQVGPTVGSIVVFENTFPGVNSTYGHVGVVQSINSSGQVTVRGANQGSSGLVTEYNCTNVNSLTFRTSINGRGDVSFWVR